MAARLGAPFDSQVKVSFPCTERSGVVFSDVVSGIQVSPGQTGYAGSLAFTTDYAVTPTNESGSPGPYTPLLSGAWPAFDTSKAILMCAVVKCIDKTVAKLPLGNFGFGPGFSVSFSSGMHTSVQDDAGNTIQIAADVSKPLVDGTTYILYVLWDPFTAGGTLTGRVLDTSGVEVHIQTTTGTLNGTLTPTAVTRVSGLALHSWNVYQLDAVPSDLATGLLWMCDVHRASNDKGPYIF